MCNKLKKQALDSLVGKTVKITFDNNRIEIGKLAVVVPFTPTTKFYTFSGQSIRFEASRVKLIIPV